MKIQKITYPILTQYKKDNSSYNKKTDNRIQNFVYNPSYYQDFNITFTGRTPDDFYAQDFNRNNMPDTMKEYLYYDYENRQNIPPEQMMREVFKYIEIADNFEDVKSIYPDESLFKDMHENTTKPRKSILSEIGIAKELSDAPLFKDGSDNFGMYLLKKIYLDGKTLKEINKDFYKKDINDEYKGVISKPIEYSTLSSYGISYPNQAFWNSFIHTREEYKKFFVTLPKSTDLPGINLSNITAKENSNSKVSDNKSEKTKYPQRRFKIKKHKKNEIEREIINKRCTDVEFVKKTIRKRFGKDDPEASFIIRYLSPIMTVASDRAHMSQEIKNFAEHERLSGKISDEATLFGRFWKNNPKMLEVFSSGITDTMDMFEDIYGEGGMIPINTDLEEITTNTENKKIIDFVNPEFLELLSYAKNIDILRNEKYILHDELQKQWEKHFINRYGEAVSEIGTKAPINHAKTELTPQQLQKVESEKDGANVHKLRLKDGNYIYITSDLDEILKGQLKFWARYFPTKYADKYIKYILAQDFSDSFKLTFAAKHKNLQLPKNERMEFDDEKLLSSDKFDEECYKFSKFHYDNSSLERAARFALIDTMQSINDINIQDPYIYNMNISTIDDDLVADDSSKEEFNSVLLANKKNIDRKFDSYTTPLTSSEMNKVMTIFFDMLSKYEPEKTILDNHDSVVFISMLKDVLPIERNYKSCNAYFRQLFKIKPFVKSLLAKGMNEDMKQAKFETIMDEISWATLATIYKAPDIIVLFNSDVYNKYRAQFSPETRKILDDAITKLSMDGRMGFFNNNQDMSLSKSLLNYNPNLIIK